MKLRATERLREMVNSVLSDIVRLNGRFLRSARIDMDLTGTPPLEGYVLQASTEKSLLAMAASISDGGQCAFTWTGPYGGGKSSTALLLGNLVAGSTEGQALARKIAGPNLSKAAAKAFDRAVGKWTVIPVTGSRVSLRQAVSTKIAERFAWSQSKQEQATKDDSKLVQELTKLAKHHPILLILDELGKFLEAAADKDHDAHLLQDLAEVSARSQGRLVIVGILHQAFEAYADRLASSARLEWSKIQGRFQDLSFLSASDETVRLLGRAIETDKAPTSAEKQARNLAQFVASNRPTDEAELTEALSQTWPLNPICALLLGGITRRSFGQNERSIFGFLSSEEPGGFREFLKSTPAGSSETFGPDRLWDYLQTNFGLALAAGPLGSQMTLATEAIEKANVLGTELHVALAKSAALIEIFKNGTGLAVGHEAFAIATPGKKTSDIRKALDDLCNWGVLLRQKRIGGYALFSGSDFDLDAALERYGSRTTSSDLSQIATIAGLDHIVAKRHYFDCGVLRTFALHVECLGDQFDPNEFKRAVTRKASSASGVMVMAVAPNDPLTSDIEAMMGQIVQTLKKSDLVSAVTLAGHGKRLIEDAGDLAALAQVQKQVPQVSGDRIARRAIRAREGILRNRSNVELQRMMLSSQWQILGADNDIEIASTLSIAASRLADCAYHSTPIIHSELLQKDKPSSSAAAALRSLCYAMVQNPDQENLGFEGFPAAFGLYLTTLFPSGLHRKTQSGYSFEAPANNEFGLSLQPAWKILGAKKEHSLADVYKIWQGKPYGMKLGVMPVLALAFMLANRSRYAVYQDGRFVSELDDIFVDRMLQDPSAIVLRRAGRSETQLAFLSRLAQGLDISDVSALSVASAAFQRTEALSDFAKRTSLVSNDTRKIRDAIRHADDPEMLLFETLPSLEVTGDLAEKTVRAIEECEAVFSVLEDDLRRALAQAIGVPTETFAGSRERAESIKGLSSDLKFEAFAARVGELELGTGSLEAVAGTLQPKPMRDWSDRNREGALSEVAKFGRRFRQAEAVALMRDRKSNTEAIALIVGIDPKQPPILQSFELSENEKETASKLAEQIIKDIGKSKHSHELALAALARAVAALTDNVDKVEA
ncbi:MAG: ATP-binding protein [Rhodobacteraceae bacterium]|nr:ATP-binding protein [Paracoccaceae bacterium]